MLSCLKEFFSNFFRNFLYKKGDILVYDPKDSKTNYLRMYFYNKPKPSGFESLFAFKSGVFQHEIEYNYDLKNFRKANEYEMFRFETYMKKRNLVFDKLTNELIQHND